LGTLGTQFSVASAINTKGQIVGTLGPPPDAEYASEDEDIRDPFLFYQEVMTRLPGLCCPPESYALAISPEGIVVGQWEDIRVGTQAAWVYENGTTRALPELADGDVSANGINLAGNIVGQSQNANGHGRAVLWQRQ